MLDQLLSIHMNTEKAAHYFINQLPYYESMKMLFATMMLKR